MNSIEIIILLLLVFLAVPEWCRRVGRPALAYSAFVLLGLLLSPLANAEVETVLRQAGQVGFLLLLFEVGLEIDLPPFREFLRPLGFSCLWSVVQYPFVLAVCGLAGLALPEACVAAAGLTGCSVGMAHPAWKQHPELTESSKWTVLHIMVALEMLAIVVLSVDVQLLDTGLSWKIGAKLLVLGLVVFLIARFAVRLVPLFQTILDKTTHWRVHWLTILLLVVCAAGERVGLGAPKTAFFLGLALNRTQHHGEELEEVMAPISHGFLIPIFFVALGLRIDWRLLASWDALLAVGLAGLLLGFREVLHRRWLRSGAHSSAYLLLCPNLTLVALAASVLLEHSPESPAPAWLLLVGLFVTVPALTFLPAETSSASGDVPSASSLPP